MNSSNKFIKPSESKADVIPDNIVRHVEFRTTGEEIDKRVTGFGRASRIYEAQHIGGDDMDDLLKSYIEKVDRDQSELKIDMREREERTEKRISESEGRMDARLDRIEKMIISQNENFDKIDDKISKVNEEVSNKLDDYRKFMWGIAISIFLAIAAMIVSLIVA